MSIEQGALAIGLSPTFALLAMLLWSIAFPEKRLWPPKKTTMLNQLVVWGLTTAVFVSAFALGVIDWNSLEWPSALRWGLGFPLIIAGNLVVWKAVFNIGMRATSGEADELKTDGFYRYSRNPQYIADIGILTGWAVLCASIAVIPVVAVGIIVLLVAPLAEEPWLKNVYGKPYEDYRRKVRRYL